ncbi:MAG: hypothetical protein RBU37_09390 [Myxococcota bacterium]|jgi:hypothetical protein|nr:hypothetical protein [Myxococcota bacterium]
MRALIPLLLALSLVSCADDPTINPVDQSTEQTDQVPDNVPQDVVVEDGLVMENPELDLADCFSGCSNESALFDFAYTQYKGLRGVIDGECHQYTNGYGPDLDIVSIRAPVGTPLEIVIEPAQGSLIDPLLLTHDGARYLNYNDNLGPGQSASRSVIIAPYANELPIHVIVQDARNYFNYNPKQYYDDCSQMLGGDDYAYILRVRRIDWPTEDLGNLSQTLTGRGTIAAPGDVKYFSFTAPGNAQPTVTLNRTGSSDFVLSGSGLKTSGGDLQWTYLLADESNSGSLTIPATRFKACLPSGCDSTATFGFVVLDWEGNGADNYTFDVLVEL